MLEQFKGVYNRKVPPELGSLSEHHADPASILLPLARWRQPHHINMSRSWHKDPRKHLDSRRFSCAIGTDVPHQFPTLKREVHIIDRSDNIMLARNRAAEISPKPSAALIDLEILAQIFYGNNWHLCWRQIIRLKTLETERLIRRKIELFASRRGYIIPYQQSYSFIVRSLGVLQHDAIH